MLFRSILDRYILSEHAVWREDVRDYVFNSEFDEWNDNDIIEARLKDIQDYENRSKQRAVERRQLTEMIRGYDNQEIDMSLLYETILNQITNDHESSNRYISNNQEEA